MIAQELPTDEVLASWQHVEQRALDLRAAGIPGTLEELRVRAYLDLLQERRTSLTVPGPGPAGTPATAGPQDTSPEGNGGGPGSCGPDYGPGGRGPAGAPRGSGPGGRPGADTGPSLAALVNITVQWPTLTGHSAAPAEVGGYGTSTPPTPATWPPQPPATPAPAGASPHCTPTAPPPPTAAHPAATPHPPASARATGPGPDPPPGSWPQDWISGLHITMTPITRGSCDHPHAETGYRPSRKLRHLVRARNAWCTAPGCSRSAARCDVDHTIAWDHGGLTCECDLAPLCRHHHRCKQAEGWRLEQPEPGVLIWHTPADAPTPPDLLNTPPSALATKASTPRHANFG